MRGIKSQGAAAILIPAALGRDGASNRLTTAEQNKLGAAAVALSPKSITSLQETIHSKVTGFVIDKEADYKTIKLAIKEAGY